MTTSRDDPFQSLPTTQFKEEIEKQSTFELTSCRLLTCEQYKELAILRVQGQEGSRHQRFLHETPEDRIADSLERIEGHLQRMGQSA